MSGLTKAGEVLSLPDVLVAFSCDSESLRDIALSNDVLEFVRFTFTVFDEDAVVASNVIDADASSSVGSVHDVLPVT